MFLSLCRPETHSEDATDLESKDESSVDPISKIEMSRKALRQGMLRRVNVLECIAFVELQT